MILMFHPDDPHFEDSLKTFIESNDRVNEIYYLKEKKVNLALAYQAEHWIKHKLVTVDYVDSVVQILHKEIQIDTLYFYPELSKEKQVPYFEVCPLALNAMMARNCNLVSNIVEALKYFKVFKPDFLVEYVMPSDVSKYQKETQLSLECAQAMCQNYPSNLTFV